VCLCRMQQHALTYATPLGNCKQLFDPSRPPLTAAHPAAGGLNRDFSQLDLRSKLKNWDPKFQMLMVRCAVICHDFVFVLCGVNECPLRLVLLRRRSASAASAERSLLRRVGRRRVTASGTAKRASDATPGAYVYIYTSQ